MTRKRRSFRPGAAKRELLRKKLEQEGLAADRPHAETPGIPRRAEPGPAPLSYGQERLWFLDRLQPGSTTYLMPSPVRLTGRVRPSALIQTLDEILRRHEVLRTRFEYAEGEDERPRQRAVPPTSLRVPRVELSRLTPADRQTETRRLVDEEVQRPIALNSGRLLRAGLLRRQLQEHVLTLTLHHIASDGMSSAILLRELTALYRAFVAGRPSPLAPLPLQYADYAVWQRQRLAGETGREHLRWWRQRLAGAPPVLDLPRDRSRPPRPSHRGAVVHRRCTSPTVEAFDALARGRRASRFMVWTAAFAAFLHRMTGRYDLLVGTPAGHRDRPELEALLGFFVNTLPLRLDVSGHPSFATLLDRVRRETLEAFEHQEMPFEKLIDALDVARDARHSPLVQVMLSTGADTPTTLPDLPDLELAPQPFGLPGAKLDLLVHPTVGSDGLHVTFEYATDLWDRTSIERFAHGLHRLLETAVSRPETDLSQLSLLSPGERQQILVEWGASHPVSSSAPNLAEAFFRVARSRPDAVAVTCGDRQLTYGELDRRSGALARRLGGLRTGAPVALCLERDLDVPIVLLAVVRAGGAYVPLDPDHPDRRHADTLEDSGAEMLIASKSVLDTRPALEETAGRLGLPVVVPGGSPEPRAPRVDGVDHATPSESAAYVIYTSGSTGRPKGVVVSHGQVLRLFAASPFPMGPDDVWTLFHSYAFDFSVWELWGALLFGGRLVVVPYLETRSPEDFLRLLADERVTVLNQTPSAFRQLDAVDGQTASHRSDLALRLVVFGGEALDLAGLAPWFRRRGDGRRGRGPRLVNMYGITETTVHVTHRSLSLDDAKPGTPSVIGRPLDDLRVHVLHPRSLEPQPLAAPGEMWVGGAGVAQGYLGRPGLTADRFRPDPYSPLPGARLYRSGDLARRTPRGELIYLGRLDQQVKVRGFRIELGEIEAVLAAHAGVRDAVVLARDDDPGERRLVAYVVPDEPESPPTVTELRAHAAGRLPPYMVPAAFVILDELPLNANGKLDRSALPAPGTERPEPEDTWVAPRTEAEIALAGIWARVLRLERVGRHDHFFELGGDSILSIQIVARARREGLSLKPQDVFTHPTVAELAEVAGTREAPARPPEQGPVTGPVPLTPMQRALVLDDPTDLHWHNQALLLAAAESLPVPRLAQGLAGLVHHHDALRLRLRRGPWGWEQEIAAPEDKPPDQIVVPTVDLSRLAPKHRRSALEAAATRAQASLDLERGPLLRMVRFRLDDDSGTPGPPERLVWAIHHLAVDGVSWRILLEDLQTIWRASEDGRPVELPPKTSSFKAWAQAQDRRSRTRGVTDELDHWIDVEVATPPPLPMDGVPGPHPQATSRTVVVPLPEESTRALLTEVPAAYRTGIDDVLLTALALAVARWTGVPHLRIDLEGHGRNADDDLDLSRTVGWFTSLYPVHLSLEGVEELGPALQTIKEQLRVVPGRGQGYGLLRYVNQELEQGGRLRRIAARHLGSQISFNYLGQTDFEDGAGAGEVPTGPWQPAEESSGTAESPRRLRPHALAVSGAVAGGRLMMRFGYSVRAHREETIGRLAVSFRNELTRLIEHCRRPDVFGATPSDFPLAGIDQATVDELFATYGPVEDVYPLSPLQEGMLFHTLAEPHRHFYFEQMTAVLEGAADLELLEQALASVVQRHPVLRTAFVWERVERPLQVVLERVRVPWRHEDWQDVPEVDRASEWAAWLAEDRRRGFDLTRAPLLRAATIRLEPNRVRLVWSWHHLLLDGWSVPRVIGELFSAYEALSRGEEPRASRTRPYADYIAWLGRQDPDEAKVFWKGLLQDVSEPTPLPIYPSPASIRAREPLDEVDGRRDVLLPADLTEALEARSRGLRVTLNTMIQGALAVLLARHGGGPRVVFGATTSGRPTDLAGVEEMVGLFINTLPLAVEVDRRRELGPWLREIQDLWTLARRFEYTPLARIQRWSGLPEGTPLFQTLLVFENYPRGEALSREEGSLQARGFESLERTNYPLTVVAAPGPRFALRLAWPAGRFELTAVRRLHDRLEALLTDMVHRPDTPVGDLSLLRDGERHQLLREWSRGSDSPAPAFPDVAGGLAWRAEERPDAVAVTTGEGFLTYGELIRRSEDLARELGRRGVGPEIPVAVRLPRSIEQIVAWTAVLRAGGVYLPLDPAYPRERLDFMAEDSGSTVEIDADGTRGQIRGKVSVRKLLDHPGRLAYLIYTSGSTGRPKGVGVSHGALANLSTWHAHAYGIGPGVHAAQTAGLSFDASIAEIVPYLLSGATLHLPPGGEILDPAALRDRWVREGVEIAFLPTPLAEAALELSWPVDTALRTLLTAGDRLRRRPPTGLPFHLVNNYGPTENAVASTFGLVLPEPTRPAGGSLPSIGRPISGIGVLVLDGDLQPVPLGAPGELGLTGASLARGYLGRPAETAATFVPHPVSDSPGARLYRTGDRVRFLPDGRLDFLGRLDNQVQVRGVRVEPGEVEAVLLEHPDVTEAVVAPRTDAAGTRLVAWVVTSAEGSTESPTASTLRPWLARRVPEPMLPAAFVEIEALPLTPSGKVDRRRLPAPDAPPDRSKTVPRNETETILAGIWSDLLGIEDLGVEDDFFELGGDSILSIQVASRARRQGVELSPGQVFDHPTLAGQAAVAQRSRGEADRPAGTSTPVSGPAPLTPIQRWLFEDHAETLSWFNQSVLLIPREELDPTILDAALVRLTARHETLRVRYRREAMLDPDDGAPFPTLSVVDLSSLPEDGRGPALTRAAKTVQAGFDPARGRVFRAVHFDLGTEQRLFLAAHHLAVDAVSWRLLLDDLESLLDAFETGVPPALPPVTPFRLWAHRLQELAATDDLATELAHWSDPARREPSRLPVDGADDPGTAAEARHLTIRLSPTRTRALLDAAPRIHRARLEDLLLAALTRAVGRWLEDSDRGRPTHVVIDLEGHGRDEGRVGLDASHTVGWFTTLYPVLLPVPETDDPADWVTTTRRELRRVPGNGMGWGLLRYLCPDASIRQTLADFPRPQIGFNYLGRLDAGFRQAGATANRPAGRFVPASEDTGSEASPHHRRDHLLDLDAAVTDDHLGIRLTYSSRAHRAATVERLAQHLRQALQTLAGDLRPTSPLVCLAEAPEGPPVVCVHAAAGRARGYEPLARELSGELPVWGMEARGLDGEPPRDDVGDMAAAYLEAVDQEMGEGPSVFLGWSFGALVAAEMGRLRGAAGGPVPLLVVVDQEPELIPLPEGFDEVDWMLDLAGGGLALDAEELRALPDRETRLTRAYDAADAAGRLPPGLDRSQARHLFDVWLANHRAGTRWRPAPYPGEVLVFRAADQDHPKPDLGWEALAPGRVVVVPLPGEHRGLLSGESVRVLARELRTRLALPTSPGARR